MDNSKILIYDGSFNGFLTAVHTAFKNNYDILGFQKETYKQKGLFADVETIVTDLSKAKTVWESIETKNHNGIRNIYFAYLSEMDGVDFMLYQFIRKIYGRCNEGQVEQIVQLETKISKLALSVRREKSHVENMIDFKRTNDDIYIADVEPSYNILPLISRHFRYRYPKHPWIIFDKKRDYGLLYNGSFIEIISKEIKNMYLNSSLGFHAYAPNSYRQAI
ncbi:MAG: TIGR03915 family putative DNA repair protein [Maribacter sp.]|nr:TIGR03915 family putative DNA repair protein [Maribacter sp.]